MRWTNVILYNLSYLLCDRSIAPFFNGSRRRSSHVTDFGLFRLDQGFNQRDWIISVYALINIHDFPGFRIRKTLSLRVPIIPVVWKTLLT